MFVFLRFSTLQEALITIPAIEEAKNGKKRLAKEDYDEDLWCTHCMDDPSIEICGFCGCKVMLIVISSLLLFNLVYTQKCFGRFDTHLMVLCDNCDRETHTFCMNPPSMEVPEEDPWYCEACIESGEVVYPKVEPEQQQEEIKDNTNKKRRSKTPKIQEGESSKDTIKPEGDDNNGKTIGLPLTSLRFIV